jgi:hypothetical protein
MFGSVIVGTLCSDPDPEGWIIARYSRDFTEMESANAH